MQLECYLKNYATWMCHEKQKVTYTSGTKPVTDRTQSFGSRTLFYAVSIMPQIFIEDSGNLLMVFLVACI